jgi:large subunit ribosomal protein L23
MIQYEIIKRPIVTEKTNIQKEVSNQVTFEVDRRANRIEIQRAVEEIFSVRVAQVRTMHVKGKVKQRGRIVGKRRDWKKAIVKLRPGERIDFFEGV